MARYSLRRFGVSAAEAEAISQGLRGRGAIGPAPRRQPSTFSALLARLRERIRPAGAEAAQPEAERENQAPETVGRPEIDRIP